MATSGFKDIVTSGLVMSLDAANTKSYPGSGNSWNDLTVNAYNGTLTNGPVFSSLKGGNIILDGSDDHILPSKSFSATNWSLSMWVNLSTPISNSPPYYGLYCLMEGDSVTNFPAVTETGVLIYVTTVVSYSFVNNPGWHNICLNYNGTQMTGVVDGVNSGTITIANCFSTNKVRRIGRRDITDNAHPFKGSLGYISLYNRTLSVSEILQNYNAMKGRFI